MKTYVRKKHAYVEIDNVKQLCRLCLEKVEDGVAIFKDKKDVCAAVAMRIMSCVGLEMQHDSLLPNKICKSCYEKLEKYYKFRKKCEVSYQKLKYHLTVVRDKEKQNIAKLQTVSVQNIEEKHIDIETVFEEQRLIDVEIPGKEERQIDVQIIDEEERDEEKKLVIQMEDPEVVHNFVEKIVEMEQINLQPDTEPDISTFLSGVLVELGVLQQEGVGLQLLDVSTFQLETGTGEQLVLELVEENEKMEDQKPEIKVETKEPLSLLAEISANTQPKQEKTPSRAWCQVCARSFSSRSVAARHARAHSGARPHACHTCGARFQQKAVLQRHMLVHLDVRPHRCDVCDKSFTQRGALEEHARAHAAPRDRPLRLHTCTLCDKVFLHASGLSRHMYQHTGRLFSCCECGRTFNDKSSLLRHRRNFYHKARPDKLANSTQLGESSTNMVTSNIKNDATTKLDTRPLSSITKYLEVTENIASGTKNEANENTYHIVEGTENINVANEMIATKNIANTRIGNPKENNNILGTTNILSSKKTNIVSHNKLNKNLSNMPYQTVHNLASASVLASNISSKEGTVQDTYMVVLNSNNIITTPFVSSKNIVSANIVPNTGNHNVTSLPNISCNNIDLS